VHRHLRDRVSKISLEKTGWTMTFDLPFEPGIDEVDSLTPIEMLLWNTEPCPGPPTRGLSGRDRKRCLPARRLRCS
jgi:hypothetical protein